MEDKIFVKGECFIVCPECGLEIPVSIMDIVNEAEIMCPAGKFTAHPEEHSKKNHFWCSDPTECKPSFEYHKIKLSKDKLFEINEVSFESMKN